MASGQALGHLSQSAVRAVTGKKPGEITQVEYDLVTDPARELTRRVTAAVRTIAARLPLVIFFNRAEIIGGAWPSLRRMMILTGPSVIWVIGARFAAEAGAGPDSPIAQFRRDIGAEHLVQMSPDRFDSTEIFAYLQSRPGISPDIEFYVGEISRFTQGLPLAVSLTAGLLERGGWLHTHATSPAARSQMAACPDWGHLAHQQVSAPVA